MYNETFGWFSILAGLFLGLYLGIKFQREDWLGGYSSLPRRMVRMAHIAMVALGMMNVQFGQGLHRMELSPSLAGAGFLGPDHGSAPDARQLSLDCSGIASLRDFCRGPSPAWQQDFS